MQNSNKYIPIRANNKNILIIIIFLLTMYIFDNSSVKSLINGVTFTYIIKPIIWLGITFIVWRMPNKNSISKIRYRKQLNSWAFYFALFYILITIFAGFFNGFGKSPYGHSLYAILTNLLFVGSALIGREFARSYLVNSFTKKENYLVFILISLFMTIINFPFNKYVELKTIRGLVQFTAEFFAPEFCHNLFSTYLAYLGGPLTSIIYLGFIQVFQWFSPILPALKWITTALIGIISPTVFLMILTSIYSNLTKDKSKRYQSNENIFSWAVTSIISIGMIWFAVGVFPIYPSVIATGSMEPMIKPGDIILVKKVKDIEDIEYLKINDIIQFKKNEILISHRIIDIKNDGKDGLLFKTKGDNNSIADSDLIKFQDIRGTIIQTIPKLGWLTLLIKSDKDIILEEVVF